MKKKYEQISASLWKCTELEGQVEITVYAVSFDPFSNQNLSIESGIITPIDVEQAKKIGKFKINQKSGYLITVTGYAFDTKQFPFDQIAQTNFAGLAGEVQSGVITSADFPKDIFRYNVAGESGDNFYPLSFANLNPIRRAQYERVNSVRNGGITLIEQIDASTTIEQVDAVVASDTRT